MSNFLPWSPWFADEDMLVRRTNLNSSKTLWPKKTLALRRDVRPFPFKLNIILFFNHYFSTSLSHNLTK